MAKRTKPKPQPKKPNTKQSKRKRNSSPNSSSQSPFIKKGKMDNRRRQTSFIFSKIIQLS